MPKYVTTKLQLTKLWSLLLWFTSETFYLFILCLSLANLKIRSIICKTNIFNCSSEFVWVWAVDSTNSECEKEKVKGRNWEYRKVRKKKGILFIQWGSELCNLRWHHLLGLPRSAKHVRRQCIWWISSLLTTRSITNPVSDATTARVPSRFDHTFSSCFNSPRSKLDFSLLFSLCMSEEDALSLIATCFIWKLSSFFVSLAIAILLFTWFLFCY